MLAFRDDQFQAHYLAVELLAREFHLRDTVLELLDLVALCLALLVALGELRAHLRERLLRANKIRWCTLYKLC